MMVEKSNNKDNEPNEALLIIEKIENALSSISENAHLLKPMTLSLSQQGILSYFIESIIVITKKDGSMHKLRKAFE